MSARIHRFGDNVDTDAILPSQLLSSTDSQVLARGCFSLVAPGFASRVRPGDVVVAGENFGCGSSREHAPVALQALQIGAVVAASFSRIFFRTAINIGLPLLTCREAISHAVDGEPIEIDINRAELVLAGRRFAADPYPEQMRQIFRAGGLVSHMRARWSAEHTGANT